MCCLPSLADEFGCWTDGTEPPFYPAVGFRCRARIETHKVALIYCWIRSVLDNYNSKLARRVFLPMCSQCCQPGTTITAKCYKFQAQYLCLYLCCIIVICSQQIGSTFSSACIECCLVRIHRLHMTQIDIKTCLLKICC